MIPPIADSENFDSGVPSLTASLRGIVTVNVEVLPAVPGLLDKVRVLSTREKADLERLPFSEPLYRKQSGLLNGVNIVGGEGSVYEKMWLRPSIAVNAIEASSRKQAANIINDTAWARVGVRIVPDMDPAETLDLLKAHLLKQAPWGVEVKFAPETPSRWWRRRGDLDGAVRIARSVSRDAPAEELCDGLMALSIVA